MKHPFYNPLRQQVGEYDDVTKTFYTQRNALKGQIFLYKHWFNGKYFHLATAIDARNLKKLIEIGCSTIQVLISGIKSPSYTISFSPKWILENGELINYDKSKQNRMGSQIVFDTSKGNKGNASQRTLY